MNPLSITRKLASLPYTAARRPLAFFDHVLTPLRRITRSAGADEPAVPAAGPEAETSPWATAVAEQAAAPAEQAAAQAEQPVAQAEQPVAEQPVAEPVAAPAEPVLAPVPDCEPTVPTVPVTFTLPGEVGAGDVALCGDFNGWAAGSIPLSRGSDGAWQVTVPLAPGNSYRFRYLLDGERWENAWQADRYEPNGFGSDNSVIIVDWPELSMLAA